MSADPLLFVWYSKEMFSEPLNHAVKSAAHLQAFTDNFRDNLYAVSAMCSLPARMGGVLIYNRRMALLAAANRLEAELGSVSLSEAERDRIEQESYEKADAKIRAEPRPSKEEILRAAEPMAHAFRSEIEELMREGLVLIWGAIEVLASDLFAFSLNRKPSLVRLLNEDERAKRLFGVKSVGLEIMEEHGFDLSTCMGDVLLRQHAVDNVPSMKAAYFALCPTASELRDALGCKELFVLNQKRNLLVHRRGVIDEEYRSLVSDAPSLGKRLVVEAEDIGAALILARDIGATILKAGSAL